MSWNSYTVTISDDAYSTLLLKVTEYIGSMPSDHEIVSSDFLSDRFAKRAYWFAICRRPTGA
jgi:hypothetical protein